MGGDLALNIVVLVICPGPARHGHVDRLGCRVVRVCISWPRRERPRVAGRLQGYVWIHPSSKSTSSPGIWFDIQPVS